MVDIEQGETDVETIKEKLLKEKERILNDFAVAYTASQEIDPSELELVVREETTDTVVETIYYFRRKDEQRG